MTFKLTTTFDRKSESFAFSEIWILVYISLRTWYKMVTANSYKIAWVWRKIISSYPSYPRCSTFLTKRLLFVVRSCYYRWESKVTSILFSIRTIWAPINGTKVNHGARTSKYFALLLSSIVTRGGNKRFVDIWLSSSSQSHVMWRHAWNGSIRTVTKGPQHEKMVFAMEQSSSHAPPSSLPSYKKNFKLY